MNKWVGVSIFAIALGLASADAESIGGNASLSVTSTTSNVALPASTVAYPAVLIEPAVGTTTEVFYKYGAGNTTAATTSSPSFPPGGICFTNIGASNNYVAAITASGSATLRITQLTQCPIQVNGGSSGGGVAPGTPSFTIDVSRTSHAAVQCVLTVTNTATLMTALWATAGCPAFPALPSYAFAYVMPTGGVVFQRTDAVAVTVANGWQIFQNQAWPVEGQLSIAGLQLIAAGNVSTSVEVRY